MTNQMLRASSHRPAFRLQPAFRAFALTLGVLQAATPCLVAHAEDAATVRVTQPHQSLSLGLDKSKVIDLPADAHDILVANPAVADAVTRTARRLYIFGKQVGQTNIFVFDKQGREMAILDLRIERDIAGLEKTIAKYIPNSAVKAEILNDNIVLTGNVETPQDAAQAVRLAQVYVTGGEATTSQFIKSASGEASAGGGSGVSQAFEARQTSQIINLLQIAGEDQVTLKVTVAEVQRSVVKQLGINGVNAAQIDGIGFQAIGDSPFGFGNVLSNAGARIKGAAGSFNIDSTLNALTQAGVMKVLAEPSLTSISGENASFKVGGEFPLPSGRKVTPSKKTYIRDANGRVVDTEVEDGSIELESEKTEYGIGLDFTPVVLSPGRISLKIRTAVSEPTFETPFNLGGNNETRSFAIAGIRKRLADTTVELPSGGSLVIAGLVRDESRQVISGFPGLSQIPVLGTLFRSRDFQHYETELVVIVTPYLVKPAARQALARPDDNLNFTADGAGNFLGRINRVYGAMETDLPPGRYHGIVGYIYK